MYCPTASVVVVRLKPETGLLILTSTACITPPVGSLTCPDRAGAAEPWALRGRNADRHDSDCNARSEDRDSHRWT